MGLQGPGTVGFIYSRGIQFSREPSSGPVAVQLRPPGEGGVRGAFCHWRVTACSQSLVSEGRGASADTEAITSLHDGAG